MTILYTYYGQQERVYGILQEMHPESRVVIVDDGHPNPLQELPGIDVYRIEKDIPWNQPGAKNLGFHVSDGWVVCADIDHLVTKENVEELLKMKKERGHIYYLGREGNHADSWNVFLIHKEDFDEVGGYNEDFSGHYGYDDLDFRDRCMAKLTVEERRDIKVKVYAEESSSKMERDTTYNAGLYAMRQPGETEKLRFKWHKV